MPLPLNPRFAATQRPPIMEALRWLGDPGPPPDHPLVNVSQAAPAVPPPRQMREAIADIALNLPAAHLYGPDLGLPALREQIAADWSASYGGRIAPGQVAITSGCNQAFCAAIATLAREGDEVILPTPWYFNHKMWCDMAGIRAVPLPTGERLVPDPSEAARLITPRTKAIVLVTPNNPAGTEYPSETLSGFFDLARSQGLALVVDETYRDFDSRTGRPHDLFADPSWPGTLIHLYSFSKAYRLTGHRVGAMIAAESRLREVEKFIDSVTICPNQIGQHAALWGMRNLSDWLAGERAEILERRQAIEVGMGRLPGWKLLGLGAYFAYVEHPFDLTAETLARRLVHEAGILLLPGTMFMPEDDPAGQRQLRIAFANVDRDGIGMMFDRLGAFAP